MEPRPIDLEMDRITTRSRRIGLATKVTFVIALLTLVQSALYGSIFGGKLPWLPAIALVEALVLLGASAILKQVHSLFVAVGMALDELRKTI